MWPLKSMGTGCVKQSVSDGWSEALEALLAGLPRLFFLWGLLCYPQQIFGGPFQTTLERLERQVREESPEIQELSARARQKRAEAFTALTRWLPQINAQVTQTRSKDYSFLSSGLLGSLATTLVPQEVELKGWSLNLVFPIYRRATQLGLVTSWLERDLADFQLKIKEQELVWRLRELVGRYLVDSYRVATLRTAIQIAETNFRETKARYNLGQKTRIDVLRAETDLLALQSSEIERGAARKISLALLFDFLGLDDGQRGRWTEELNWDHESGILAAIEQFSIDTPRAEALSTYLGLSKIKRREEALAHSPNSQKIALEAQLQNQQSLLLTSEHWPELALQGNLNKRAPDWEVAFNGDERSTSIGLVLTIPIFSSGSLFSTHSQASELRYQAEVKKRRALDSLMSEIESETLKVESLLKAVASRKKALEQAEELQRLSQKSYQLGKSTMVELLASQNSLLEAKNNWAVTKVEYSVEVRRLAWNLGAEQGDLGVESK